MTTPSPGAKFRAAVAAERPLQVLGAINAYHALLAERVGLQGDLPLRRRRRRRLARHAGPRHQQPRRRADRRAAHHRRLRAAAAGRRRHRLRRVARSTSRAPIRSLIKAGAGAMHIEDQVGAKRCGHRPGKELVVAGRDGRPDQGRRRRARPTRISSSWRAPTRWRSKASTPRSSARARTSKPAPT